MSDILIKANTRSSLFFNLVKVLINDVQSGGSDFDFAPLCDFGPFGIVENEFGDCSKGCPAGMSLVETEFANNAVCCCN